MHAPLEIKCNFTPRYWMMASLNYALGIHPQLYPLQWGMKQEDIHPNHCPTSSNFCSPVPGIDIAIQPWMPNQRQGHLRAGNCVAPTNYAGTYRPRNLTEMRWVSMWYSWLQCQVAPINTGTLTCQIHFWAGNAFCVHQTRRGAMVPPRKNQFTAE